MRLAMFIITEATKVIDNLIVLAERKYVHCSLLDPSYSSWHQRFQARNIYSMVQSIQAVLCKHLDEDACLYSRIAVHMHKQGYY